MYFKYGIVKTGARNGNQNLNGFVKCYFIFRIKVTVAVTVYIADILASIIYLYAQWSFETSKKDVPLPE